MDNNKIYEDIASRTGGDIYIGVVGPVRTGKSTFIKRFMETAVIPNIEDVYMKERAKDELPQSGSGRTIMTAEPKFVPEDAVSIALEGGAACSVRLIDCVGYMVEGALGEFEDGEARRVTTPWFDHEVTMKEAAETGTRKVIEEHSTIGIVITTDGSISEIEREAYIEAEDRVINELKELGKPFVVLVNSTDPNGDTAQNLCCEIERKYGVSCSAVNCLDLTSEKITDIIRSVLYEFPVEEIRISLPSWIDALSFDHSVKSELISAIKESVMEAEAVRDIQNCAAKMGEDELVGKVSVDSIELGTGTVMVDVAVPRSLFYELISRDTGFEISDDGDLMGLLEELSKVKADYDKIASALCDVREKGYGVVMPDVEELTLQEPEIVRKNGRYSVRMKASAPSIHMMLANVETEVSPAVGGEKASGEIINYLLQEFEGDTGKIWESNLFGKSMHEIAGEGLQAKIKKMPDDAQYKIRNAVQRIVNDGNGKFICILL